MLSRDDLFSRLKDFDEELSIVYPFLNNVDLVIVGGSALILMGYTTRITHDIDVLHVSHSIQSLMSAYDMNTQVHAYLDCFAYNYEDRLVPVPIETKIAKFYTASLEDIVISKLYSGRAKDIDDITSPEVLSRIDWNALHRLVMDENETHVGVVSDFVYREFLDVYKDFERRFHLCAN